MVFWLKKIEGVGKETNNVKTQGWLALSLPSFVLFYFAWFLEGVGPNLVRASPVGF